MIRRTGAKLASQSDAFRRLSLSPPPSPLTYHPSLILADNVYLCRDEIIVFRAQLNLVALPKLPGSVHRDRSRLSTVVICKCAFRPTTTTFFPVSLSLSLSLTSSPSLCLVHFPPPSVSLAFPWRNYRSSRPRSGNFVFSPLAFFPAVITAMPISAPVGI